MFGFLTVVYLVCWGYLILNFKHDIHMLQQNSYRLERYWKYLKNYIGSSWRLIDVAMLLLCLSTLLDIRLSALLVSIVCLIKIWKIVYKKHKKPLVFTNRVWRIYGVTAGISTLIYVSLIFCCGNGREEVLNYNGVAVCLGALFVMTIFSWLFVMFSVVILKPVEWHINRGYWNDAKRILESMPDLKVIGITGSYGKTSTKHYLQRILSEEFEVVMTPGSYNTTMGVIRTIREMIKPYDQIFICEMGAKQKGDIKEICDLVHPQIGIITAVGPMHLETFKTIENIQSTKFELIDSLPQDGLAVINNDFEFCANRLVDNVESKRYSVTRDGKNDVEYIADNIEYSAEGTSFVVKGPDGFELALFTRLVGSCNISNLLGAIIVAIRLGVSKERIKYAVSCIEQVEHRLSIKRTPGEVTIIDDAFNSNPTGSKMALEVLSSLKTGKRIVVTPGMIELGARQYELNTELGEHIARSADIAIIVGEYNRKAISEGILNNSFNSSNLYEVGSFEEAQKVLGRLLEKGDTVLYENDLPDAFK